MSAEQTNERIRRAAVQQLRRRLRADIRLGDIAAEAGVTVQTVLRVFGSKAGLFQVAFDDLIAEMRANFEEAEPGDIAAAVSTWFDHYERYGDAVLAALAEEHDPDVAPIVEVGRSRHRARVEAVLAPQLAHVEARNRGRAIDALTCATDVYTWKLLRRDMKRSRAAAEATMRHMITALLAGG